MRMVVSEDKGSKGYVFFSFRKDSCISFDVLVIFFSFWSCCQSNGRILLLSFTCC